VNPLGRTESIGLTAAMFSKTDILAELPKPVTEWVSASAALSMVQERNGWGDAASSIAIRALSGILKSQARQLTQEFPRDEDSNRKSVRLDAAIPEKFWWARGQAALSANWATGDFSTYIDRNYLWEAIGVEFDRAEIEAMLAPISTEQNVDGAGGDGEVAAAKSSSAMPSDAEIKVKMEELLGLGMGRDAAAIVIRQVAGFEAVGNEHARRVVNGTLPRGRPKKIA
jgi:hypothetical protein